MPKPWIVEFYESRAEGCPVREFLLALDKPQRAKLVALIRLLEEQGPLLPFPYSTQIRAKLRELRTQYGKDHYRVLYFGAPGPHFCGPARVCQAGSGDARAGDRH